MRPKLIPALLLVAAALGGMLLLSLVATGTAVAQPPVPTGEPVPQIVGGQEAEPGAWPWQVALLQARNPSLYDAQFCGGSLLSELWVLTAAHCVEGAEPADIDVVAGIHNLVYPDPGYQRIPANLIIVHPDYEPELFRNDIALIRLSQPAQTGIEPGALPVSPVTPLDAGAPPVDGLLATVTGWGNRSMTELDYPDTLHEVVVPIVDNATCSEAYGDLPGTMLCAGYMNKGGRDSCGGDSGGPLVIYDETAAAWQLAGIVSWGYGCGLPGYPGVYTRVSAFESWFMPYVTAPPVDFHKAASAALVSTGDTISYTLTVTNIGGEPLPQIDLTDAIPQNTTYVDGSATAGGTLTDGVLHWSALNLDPGSTWEAVFEVTVNADLGAGIKDDIETSQDHWSTGRDEQLGEESWVISNWYANSGSRAWYAPNTPYLSDLYLILTLDAPLPPGAELSFWHAFDVEDGFDGGVVEISTDDGQSWEDLGDHFTLNGYNWVLYEGYQNPLEGGPAFSGYSGGFIESRIALDSFAGEPAQIRFRMASDESFAYDGWYIDDVAIDLSIVNQAFIDNFGSNRVSTAIGPRPPAVRFLPVVVTPD